MKDTRQHINEPRYADYEGLAAQDFACGPNGTKYRAGTADPNGAQVGRVGDFYAARGSGSVWVKETGDDTNTGWVQVSTGVAPVAGTVAGQTGLPYAEMLFYADASNPQSYDGVDPPTELTDLRETVTTPATVTDVVITDSHFNFNGTTSTVDFGTLPSELEDLFDGGGTFVAWVRPESDGELNSGRIADTSDSSANEGWFVVADDQVGSFIRLGFVQNFSGTNGIWVTDRVFRVGHWVHVVILYDAGAVANNPTFLVDGEEFSVALGNLTENSTPTGTFGSDAGNAYFIGNRSDNARTWDGDIETVQLYGRTLSVDEAAASRRLGFAALDPNMIGLDVDGTNVAKDMVVRAGSARDGGGVAADLEVAAGGLGVTGTAGDLEAHGGDAPNGGLGSVTGGAATFRGGDADGAASDGGTCVARGGDALGSSTGGGDYAARGGDGDGLAAGDTFILAGRRLDGAAAVAGGIVRVTTSPRAVGPFPAAPTIQDSGNVSIDTETGTTAANSGSITHATGSGTVTSGNFTISTGTLGDLGGVAGRRTGSVTISTGDLGAFLSSTGIGAITLQAGSATSTENIAGGQAVLRAGDGSGTEAGGDVTLDPGVALGTGRDGHVDAGSAAAIIFPEYTVAGVPSAAAHDNGVVIISDETGGRTLATSDGTDWRRVSDGAIIS